VYSIIKLDVITIINWYRKMYKHQSKLPTAVWVFNVHAK